MANASMTQSSATTEPFLDRSRPRRFLIWLFFIVVILFALVAGLITLQMWRNAPVPRTAVLTNMNGLVELRPAATENWQPATSGATLEAGYEVRTGENAAATITFFDGSVTQLSRDTTLTLTDLTASRSGRSHHIAFRQESGQTDQLVLPARSDDSWLEITTSAGVIRSQAATYQVIVAENGNTRVTVSQGELLINDGKDERTLSAGEGLTFAARTTTAPAGDDADSVPGIPLDLTATVTATPEPTATVTPTTTPSVTTTLTITATLSPTSTITATPTTTVRPTITLPATATATVSPPLPTATFVPTAQPATVTPDDNGNDNDDNGNDNDDNGNDNDGDDDNDNDDENENENDNDD